MTTATNMTLTGKNPFYDSMDVLLAQLVINCGERLNRIWNKMTVASFTIDCDQIYVKRI